MITCPVCSSSAEATSYFSRDEKHMKLCRACSAVFVFPRLAGHELLRQYSPEYFQTKYKNAESSEYTNLDIWIGKLEKCLQFSEQLLLDTPKEKKRDVLDIGCGTGKFLEVALARGWTASGLELCETIARDTSIRLGIPVIAGSLFERGLRANSYDLITMFDVIEHMETPAEAFRTCFAALKPGGILTLSTPNLDGLGRRLMKDQAFGLWPDEHILYFSPKSLRSALSRAGFCKVHIKSRDLYPENVTGIIGKLKVGPHRSTEDIRSVKSAVRGSAVLRRMRTLFNTFAEFIPWGDELVAFAVKPRIPL